MGFVGRLKFNRRFFAGLLMVLVFCGGMFKNISFVHADSFTTEFGEDAVNALGGTGNENGQDDTKNLTNGYVNEKPRDDFIRGGLGPVLIQNASKLVMWTVSSELYDDVFFSEGAKRALSFIWGVVRDFVNMFYLLVLIFLAITTILRVNKFSDKKLFFNVIVSAILVNFSLPITLVVIDFSNMLMDFFAQAIKDTLNGQSIGAFFLEHSHYATSVSLLDLIKSSAASMVQFMIEIAMAVMLFFTAISLLIRLVAYWVLIILSPLAFFSIALPNSGGFQEWKDKLLNYSFYGPIMLFFIWVSLLLLAALGSALSRSGESDTWLTFIVSYVTVMYLLYYGHDKSKSMAAKAGDTVSKIMDKGKDYAVKAGKNVGTLGMAPLVESQGKSLYTGGQTLLQRNRFTKGWTKEGAEEIQEDRNRQKKYWASSKEGKEKMSMEDLAKEEKKMKDKNIDLESVDTLKHYAKNGTEKQKKLMYLKLNEKGKLKGDDFEAAMKVGEKNNLYKNSLLKGAEKSNKAELLKYHTARRGEAESDKYLRDKIKGMLPKNEREDASGNALSDANIDANVQAFVNTHYGGGYGAAAAGGIISGTGNSVDIAKFINEDEEIAKYANIHYTSAFGAAQLNQKRKDILKTNLNSTSGTILGRIL